MATALNDTSRGYLAFVEESVFGTTPASQMTKLRITSESLKLQMEGATSDEIRDDYMPPDYAHLGYAITGGVNFEMSYGVYDDIWKGMLRGTWSAAVTTGAIATISFASGDNSINDSANGLGSFAPGDHVLVSGSASNDGVYRVVTVAAGKLTVTEGTIVTEAATSVTSVTVKHGGVLKNGTTLTSYTFERGLTDATKYFDYTGCRIGAWSFNANQRGIMTGTLSVIGLDETVNATGQGTPANPSEPTSNDIMDGSNHMEFLTYNDAVSTVLLRQLTFDLNGNLREQPRLMAKALEGVGSGTFGLELGFQAYFEDETEFADLKAGNQRNLSFSLLDRQGNRYIFHAPAIRPSDADVLLRGANGDVLVNMAFQAFRDSTLDSMFQVTRIPV